MKKMVIVGYNLEMGGAEKALINFINLFKNEYEIDLVLLEKKGPLLKEIPSSVNIFEIKTNIFKYALFRYIPIIRKIIMNKVCNKKYDIAVAYMEGRACTLIDDINQECLKIAWIHNDVSIFDIGIKEKEIKRSYSRMDKIVVVSKVSMNNFIKKYEIRKEKVQCIYNMLDENKIKKLSKEKIIKKKRYTFINVSKMRPQKRHDRLINAAKRLKDDGYDFELWLIGNGELENNIKNQIKKLKAENYIKLFGLKENPYPYIKEADCFVMSSDHEGHPLSLLESLLLGTKAISTDVSGAKEIIGDKYGYVVDIDEKSLYKAMKKMIEGIDKERFNNNLKEYKGTSEDIKKQLKELIK